MKLNNNFYLWLGMILLLEGFVLAIFSTYSFFNGFHNLDLGKNMERINSENNLNLQDYASDYKNHNWKELYVKGTNTMKWSFFGGLISSFLVGASIIYLFMLKRE